jgi:hypothetical protein
VDYAALFLQVIGVYSAIPFITTWGPNNAEPHYRRATGIALNFMFANTGGKLTFFLLFCLAS